MELLTAPEPLTASLTDLRRNTGKLVRAMRERRIVRVTDHGAVIAEIRPLQHEGGERDVQLPDVR